MFIGLSKTIARFGGFRLGMGIRLTKKNCLYILPIAFIVLTFQLSFYMLLVSFWLLYAMLYGIVFIIVSIFRAIAKAIHRQK